MFGAGPAGEPDDLPVVRVEGSLRTGEDAPAPHLERVTPRLDRKFERLAPADRVDHSSVDRHVPRPALAPALALALALALSLARAREPHRCRCGHDLDSLATLADQP